MGMRTTGYNLMNELANGEHNVYLNALTYVPAGINKDTKKPFNEHMILKIEFSDRIVTEAMFEVTYNIFCEAVKAQFPGTPNYPNIVDGETGNILEPGTDQFLKTLITNRVSFKVYVLNKHKVLKQDKLTFKEVRRIDGAPYVAPVKKEMAIVEDDDLA